MSGVVSATVWASIVRAVQKLRFRGHRNYASSSVWQSWTLQTSISQLEMLLIPNTLCWSSRKCNCACVLPAEVQLRLCVTRRSWQKLFAAKNFVKKLVTAQTQLRSYSEQQRAFGNSNICNSRGYLKNYLSNIKQF